MTNNLHKFNLEDTHYGIFMEQKDTVTNNVDMDDVREEEAELDFFNFRPRL